MSTISCFVDRSGLRVHISDHVDHTGCREYRFDLELRSMSAVEASSSPVHDRVAAGFFSVLVGTPDSLMRHVVTNGLPKSELAGLLAPEKRGTFHDFCLAVENALTAACRAKGDPCLASGCSFADETMPCLNACLEAGNAYNQACANVWAMLFKNPDNRIDVWKR